MERTESLSNAGFVEARQKAFPDVGAAWIDVAGTYAMFDGANSPVTQTFGLGMFEPLTPENLDATLGQSILGHRLNLLPCHS